MATPTGQYEAHQRNLKGPELSSKFTVDLEGYLLCNTSQLLLVRDGFGIDDLEWRQNSAWNWDCFMNS